MLTPLELSFCEEVKRYSLANTGMETTVAIACAPHTYDYISKVEVSSYERVKIVFQKLFGDNFDERLVNRDKEFKGCKSIEILLVGV